MPDEAVFYCDVLGFSAKAAGPAGAALDALSALANLLGTPGIMQLTGNWPHRYSLSDRVFLTHPDLPTAVRQAALLVHALAMYTLREDQPVLVRGGLAHGSVRHVKGIFLTSNEPANLVGEAVVAAVRLEQVGLKGPRILVTEAVAQSLVARDAEFARWFLRPTSMPGVWEILWLLQGNPDALDELSLHDLCQLSVRLLAAHGGDPIHGEQYRQFLLLCCRAVERVVRYRRAGKIRTSLTAAELLPPAAIVEICDSTSGLPTDFLFQLRALLTALAAPVT